MEVVRTVEVEVVAVVADPEADLETVVAQGNTCARASFEVYSASDLEN